MFLMKKHDVSIKDRGCADIRSQCKYTTKESLPTISLEAMMMTCVIDAKERRYITVTKIPGAFLNTDMDECTHDTRRDSDKLIMRLEPKLYRKHV